MSAPASNLPADVAVSDPRMSAELPLNDVADARNSGAARAPSTGRFSSAMYDYCLTPEYWEYF